MKERIQAVQRVFWSLCAAGIVVAALGVPLGDDGEMMEVLEELRAFDAGFDQAALETSLLAHARGQGRLTLDAIAKGVVGAGVPSLVADGPPVEPRAAVDLATLGEVYVLSRPGAAIEIASPDAQLVAVALGWRLARRSTAVARWVLKGVAFAAGSAADADVAREREVASARVTALDAGQAYADAVQVHDAAEGVYDARRKWKAPWKALLKADEARKEAQALMDVRAGERDAANARYEAIAKTAQAFRGGRSDRHASNGVVVATVAPETGGDRVTFVLPAPLVRRPAAVGRLRGADFPVAHRIRVWDDLAGDSIDGAIAQVLRRFSWHYVHVEYGGAKFGGTTALQIAPALFVALLGILLRRTGGVGRSYNPFDVPEGTTLPAVGFGARALDLVPLVALPLLGCALCAWSLVELGELVIVPVVSGLLSIVLGGLAFNALGALSSLREAVTRTHSRVPHAPPA